jgi:hypothetical protein
MDITRKVVIVLLLNLVLQFSLQSILLLNRPWFGNQIERRVLRPGFGSGRGAPGIVKQKRRRIQPICLWASLQELKNDAMMNSLVRMNVQEFEELLAELDYLKPTLWHYGMSLKG